MKTIRIANGQGFWGDCIDAPLNLIKYGKIDYLTLDYLAEVTISIMQRQKKKNKNLGYATDFIDLIDKAISNIKKNKIKIIANAGGVNPEACREEILKISKKKKIAIKVAVVKGDDIFNQLEDILDNGQSLDNLYNDEKFSSIKERVYSANVYIDSFSISDALKLGADIVLCGRISDPGLVVGPAIYEFGWKRNEYNKLASATVAGHILECGAQCTGGNFSEWRSVQGLERIGYPITTISNSGDFEISKPEDSGGLINKFTISEQILYELGNPKEYISPDVCVDFTSFNIEEIGENKIRITNVKGNPPTDTYKVSISYFNGYKASGQLTISAPNALDKAKLCSDIVWKKLKNNGKNYNKTSTEFLGLSSCHKDLSKRPNIINEIVLRLGVKSFCRESVYRFTKELSPLITSGPPGVTGFSEGRPKVREIVAYWPTLIDKKFIKTTVNI